MGKYSEIFESKQVGQREITGNTKNGFSAPENDFDDAQKKYGSIDPRKDKAVDHQYWEDILWNAWHFTKPLYYILHGIRCGGGELTLTKDSFRLTSGEWSPAEWEDIKRKYLDQVKDSLVWILKLTRFGKVTEETLPPGMFEERPNIEQGRMFG